MTVALEILDNRLLPAYTGQSCSRPHLYWICSTPLFDVLLIDTLLNTYDLYKMIFQPDLMALGTKYCQFHCSHRKPHWSSAFLIALVIHLLPREGTHFRPSDASLRSMVPAARVGVQESRLSHGVRYSKSSRGGGGTA
jgi:hypothetical protein